MIGASDWRTPHEKATDAEIAARSLWLQAEIDELKARLTVLERRVAELVRERDEREGNHK